MLKDGAPAGDRFQGISWKLMEALMISPSVSQSAQFALTGRYGRRSIKVYSTVKTLGQLLRSPPIAA
jgi:hypothetical protein